VFEKADPGGLSETFGLSVERLNGRTDVLNGTRVDAYLQYSEVQKGLKQISPQEYLIFSFKKLRKMRKYQ
jgi:hypothetical protein